MGKKTAFGKRGGAKRAAGGTRKRRVAVALVAAAVLAVAVPLAASALSGGLSMPLASASTATVTFSTGEGGSSVDSQTVASGGHAQKPAKTPTRAGYVFGGWYTSSDGGSTLSTMDYDFKGAAVSGDLVLYAKWIATSAKPADPSSYFMATAALPAATLAKIAAGDSAAVAAEANYRSEADVAADMAVLHGTAGKNGQGEGKAAVTSRWEGYMGSDPGGSSYSHTGDYAWTSSTVHLYTKWNGETVDGSHAGGSDENAWLEMRVVEVGAHLNTAGDATSADGSAVTFMAVHSLPTAKAMKGTKASYSNSGGWKESDMRTDTMENYVLANLDGSFKSALKAVKKETVNTSDPASDSTVSTTDDSVWLMSYKELTGTTQSRSGDEGEQYAWFSGKVASPTASNTAIANLCYTRPGSWPSAMNNINAWLRSPSLDSSSGFLSVRSVGRPNYYWDSYRVLCVCPALSM